MSFSSSSSFASSPLQKIVFIQRISLFACNKPKRILKLCYVNRDFRETILQYSFSVLLKPFLLIPFDHLRQYHAQVVSTIEEDIKASKKYLKRATSALTGTFVVVSRLLCIGSSSSPARLVQVY